ncbi:MAG: hypothetical protein ACREON_18055 [Gemmatimonadaceae bacterium]
MTETDLIAFVSLLMFLAFTVPTTVWAWRRSGRRTEIKGSSMSDERLAHIEQAVDAMAIEIERISEGQRYTTRLLAERAESTGRETPETRRR